PRSAVATTRRGVTSRRASPAGGETNPAGDNTRARGAWHVRCTTASPSRRQDDENSQLQQGSRARVGVDGSRLGGRRTEGQLGAGADGDGGQLGEARQRWRSAADLVGGQLGQTRRAQASSSSPPELGEARRRQRQLGPADLDLIVTTARAARRARRAADRSGL